MPEAKLSISKLTPQSNGNYAVTIDGKVFGERSAHPKAAFVVYEGKGRPFGEGSHEYVYNGVKLKITVKDLSLSFHPEEGPNKAKNIELNKKAMEELLASVVVTQA